MRAKTKDEYVKKAIRRVELCKPKHRMPWKRKETKR